MAAAGGAARRRGDAALQAAAAAGFYRNLAALGFPRSAEAREAAAARLGDEMFDGPGANEAGMLAAVFFLLQRIKGPAIRKAFATCYPVQDNAQRRELKMRIRDELAALEKTGDIPLGVGRGSTLNMAKGRSAQVLVWCLSLAAMRARIARAAPAGDKLPPRLESEEGLNSAERPEDVEARLAQAAQQAEDRFEAACIEREARSLEIAEMRAAFADREVKLTAELESVSAENLALRAALGPLQDAAGQQRDEALRARDLLLDLGSDENQDYLRLRQQLDALAAQQGAEAGIPLPEGCTTLQQVLQDRVRPQVEELRRACKEVESQVPAELAPLRNELAAQKAKLASADAERALQDAALKHALVDNARAVLAQALR